jgi:lipoprotein-anchoring transpeptidase ErfK/SrfK
MPWMNRITWSGTALHAGIVPGYPASHGCIRLTNWDATELAKMVKPGVTVEFVD